MPGRISVAEREPTITGVLGEPVDVSVEAEEISAPGGWGVRLSADRGEGLCLKIHGAITEDQMRALLATCKAVRLLA
jgi:hypothetical protein